jgi:hypothetical protein
MELHGATRDADLDYFAAEYVLHSTREHIAEERATARLTHGTGSLPHHSGDQAITVNLAAQGVAASAARPCAGCGNRSRVSLINNTGKNLSAA